MPFELRNSADNSILHSNTLTAEDLDMHSFQDQWLHMSYPVGEMKMKQWIFDGIRIGYTDWHFKKPVTFDWNGDMDVVTMYFNLTGGITLGSKAAMVTLGNNQQNMFYDSEASGSMKVDKLRMKSLMIQFNRQAFVKIAEGGNDVLKRFAEKVAEGKAALLSGNGIFIDVDILNCINGIMNCTFSESLKKIYFLSKVMELMVLQAEAHNRAIAPQKLYVKTDYDKDRLVFAKEYMLQNIEMPPTIPELAIIAGINEFKLKKGYKELFGTTIFSHLAEARLDLAKSELQMKQKTVTQIAFELGYSSVQHFSRAYKAKFGLSPKQAQLQY